MYIRTKTGTVLNLAQVSVLDITRKDDSCYVLRGWELHSKERLLIHEGSFDDCKDVLERLEDKLQAYVI